MLPGSKANGTLHGLEVGLVEVSKQKLLELVVNFDTQKLRFLAFFYGGYYEIPKKVPFSEGLS